jgi:hypothetical protein
LEHLDRSRGAWDVASHPEETDRRARSRAPLFHVGSRSCRVPKHGPDTCAPSNGRAANAFLRGVVNAQTYDGMFGALRGPRRPRGSGRTCCASDE